MLRGAGLREIAHPLAVLAVIAVGVFTPVGATVREAGGVTCALGGERRLRRGAPLAART